MGTNYYWHQKPKCPHCGRHDKPKHIGKSSAGWVFSLHVGDWVDLGDEEILVSGLDDWKRLFSVQGSWIDDEYGDVVTSDEMISTITDRKARDGMVLSRQSDHDVRRARRGDGTYDLCQGEFR